MIRDLRWFDSLSKRDLENGAVINEIRDVFKTVTAPEPCPRNCELPTDAYELGFTHCPYCGRQLEHHRYRH